VHELYIWWTRPRDSVLKSRGDEGAYPLSYKQEPRQEIDNSGLFLSSSLLPGLTC